MAEGKPAIGLVIRDAYLWWNEARQGREEGRKDTRFSLPTRTIPVSSGPGFNLLLQPAHRARSPAPGPARVHASPLKPVDTQAAYGGMNPRPPHPNLNFPRISAL
jgi:hypothetical protein